MRQKKKEKLSELIQERILKAWLVRIKVAAAPVGAPRDWNPAVAVLTSGGNLMAYSLPDLRTCFNYNELVAPTDHRQAYLRLCAVFAPLISMGVQRSSITIVACTRQVAWE